MSDFKTIDDLNVSAKRVLVRLDLNVPMLDGCITDTARIDRVVPTLNELSKKGAKVIVISHLGRPKGRVVSQMSLEPVAQALSKSCGLPVAFATDTIGESAKQTIDGLNNGEICMLENLRFIADEEANDKTFAFKLSNFGDAYVNDAFSCSHRAHASTVSLAHFLPSVAGRLMQVEIESLTSALETPEPPLAAVIGGSKISTKIEVLGNLIRKVDLLFIGGGMANTFLFAQGYNVGKSVCEKNMIEIACKILADAKLCGCEVVLPIDCVVARVFEENASSKTVRPDSIPLDAMMLDVGSRTVADIVAKLEQCKTLVWNGPFGAFELYPFDSGTNAVAFEVARLTKKGSLISVAGGGDTVAALAQAGVCDDFSYISTAGGAFLEWMQGKKLPGVEVLKK